MLHSSDGKAEKLVSLTLEVGREHFQALEKKQRVSSVSLSWWHYREGSEFHCAGLCIVSI